MSNINVMGGGTPNVLLFRRRMAGMKSNKPIVPPNDEIWYEAESEITLYKTTNVLSHTFSNGKGKVKFSKDITICDEWFRTKDVIKVYVPKTTTSIYQNAFRDCKSLIFIQMPDTLQTLVIGCFYGCSKLALTKLPNALTKIEGGSFQNCTKLAISEIPSGVSKIGERAFIGTTSIKSLTVPRVAPPSCEYAVFTGTNYPIYVPSESVDNYKNASGWSTYADRIFAIPE